MRRLLLLLSVLAGLTACGNMNRAVGVLPNTLDDLAARTEPLRSPRNLPPPTLPGDEALAARRTDL